VSAPPLSLAAALERRLKASGCLVNGIGTLLVTLYLTVVFPPPADGGGAFTLEFALAFAAVYFLGACAVGMRAGARVQRTCDETAGAVVRLD